MMQYCDTAYAGYALALKIHELYNTVSTDYGTNLDNSISNSQSP